MQFNRRGFLMSVIGAVMTGTVADLKVTKAALADPVVGRYAMTVKLQQGLYAANKKLLVARESQKDILRQQNDAVTAAHYAHLAQRQLLPVDTLPYNLSVEQIASAKALHPVPPKLTALIALHQEKVNIHAEGVMSYCLNAFTEECDEEALWQIDDMFNRKGIFADGLDTMTVEGLQRMAASVVPVAVAKRMLATEKVWVSTIDIPSFTAFAIRYKNAILNSPRRPPPAVRDA